MKRSILSLILFILFTAATGQVTDIDGNRYRTVKIGDQEWMAENLRVTRFRNGDPVSYIRSLDAWTHSDLSKRSGYCAYRNDTVLAKTYGFLYNHYAVVDSRNIAPEGWRVATWKDWLELKNHVKSSMNVTYRRNEFEPLAKRFRAQYNSGDFGAEQGIKVIQQFNDSLAQTGSEEHHGLYYNAYAYAGGLNFFGTATTNLGVISALLSKEPTQWDTISAPSYVYKMHWYEGGFRNIPATGTDLFGFNGLPAGIRSEMNFYGLKHLTAWWLTDQGLNGTGLSIRFQLGGLFGISKEEWEAVATNRTWGLPIRCVKVKK
jgi:uncharacterized protein (TIGR02145 family)